MKTIFTALCVMMFLAGCHIHGGRYHHDPYDDYVVIEAGHIHTADCGHYYHRGRWYHHQGHHHGPGCGHHHRDGLWIRID